LTSYTDGATIFEANGIYKHEDGNITIEKTLKIELLFIEKTTVLTIIDELKRIFNQEAVVLQEDAINSEMI
jgi:hypothetical protein